jgi:hypothetical protein
MLDYVNPVEKQFVWVVITCPCRVHMAIRLASVWNSSSFSVRVRGAWPLLLSSGQSSWLHIQRSGFDSRCYQIFWEILGLERGSLSLMSIIEELLERKSSGSGLGNRDYGCRIRRADYATLLYPQKLALTSPTNGGRSVGIVRSRTHATEFGLFCCCCAWGLILELGGVE